MFFLNSEYFRHLTILHGYFEAQICTIVGPFMKPGVVHFKNVAICCPAQDESSGLKIVLKSGARFPFILEWFGPLKA